AVSAFDHRFGWSTVPLGGVVGGDALVTIGFYLIFRVYRENTFTSATIEVSEDQRVVSTGPVVSENSSHALSPRGGSTATARPAGPDSGPASHLQQWWLA